MEDYLYGMMNFIKAHEIMYESDIIQRTDKLLDNIYHLQSILENYTDFLGTHLINNGQIWKEMGWLVDQSILDATKQRLMDICINLQDELYEEMSKHGYTEKVMDCNISGLELVVVATKLTGQPLTIEQFTFWRSLVILYGQWTCQEMQSLGYTNNTGSSRLALRLLQLLNNMTRILTAFNSLISIFLPSNQSFDLQPLNTLASSLVDVTFNVISFIDQRSLKQNQVSIRRSNVMRNTFLPILYLEQSLITFADAVVAIYNLTGSNTQSYNKRIKWLHGLVDDTA
ncbi:uncharacterized protein BX664DRAFT_163039 [Halteromyces radiatus]|uniref:uncharacterized protein n=1 Tax=Halteromyces radiatus TaxID=101107 RepID=UPI00221F630D|nr:uncharacterized protein BX664DRAFT_163039 [Halteromyces radiatus]KAI8086675.1 hypothetical protein BX664DRAFT_163039 [Halteromyces radiatus]